MTGRDSELSRKQALAAAASMALPLLAGSAAMAEAPVACPTPACTMPTAPAGDVKPASITDGRELYFKAREHFYNGDWVKARDAFVASQASGFTPGGDLRNQVWFLEQMNRQLQQLQQATSKLETANVEKAVQLAQAKAQAEAQGQQLTAAAGVDRQQQAAVAYRKGQEQLQAGQWIAARSAFAAAKELGYQHDWTQTSVDDYLSEIDKKAGMEAHRASADRKAAEEQASIARRAAAAEAARLGLPVLAVQDGGATTGPAGEAPAAEAPAAAPQDNAANDAAAAAALQRAKAAQLSAEARDKAAAARKALDAGNRDEAARLAGDALALDPNNAEANDVRTRAVAPPAANTANAGAGQQAPAAEAPARVEDNNPLNAQARDVRARRGDINYAFDQALREANAAIGRRDFQGARNAINAARVARDRARQDFTFDEQTAMDSRLAQTNISLETTETAIRRTEDEARNRNTALQEEDRIRRERIDRDQTVRSLVRNATDLTRQKKYNEALGVINQILVLDPSNEYAIGARPLVEDQANFLEQRRYREQYDSQWTKQLNAAEEKKIPYDDIMRYPDNWPELSARRDQTVREEQGGNAVDDATRATLDRRLPELRFDNVGFADVVEFLRDVTGANIFVNWNALTAANIDRNAPVTARLRDVPFRKALTLILESVGGGTTKLGYSIDEGVITISTADDLAKNVVNRVYDIRDLIIDIPDFDDVPTFSLDQGGGGGGGNGSGGGGGGGGGLFGGGGGAGGGGGGQEESGRDRQELVDQIIKLITTTVAPDSWRDAGGSVGSLSELGGQLIVTQTPENQQALQSLLDKLRETRAIQVTVETRFLTVQRNFLEDVGFDVDAVFNLNNSWSDKFSPIAVGLGTSDLTAGPTTGVPGSLAGGSAAGAAQQSLSISGSFIDDFQVNFLLRATQGNANSTILTAPRVTLFNGQRAYVMVATQRAYVSDLDPVVGGGNAAAFDPEIDTVESGVLLDVQATVSSDRKYVTLTLRPQLSQLVNLFTFAFAGSSTATDGNTGSSFGIGLVQQPELQITQVRTSVSVPDGGTLLLGGQTLAGEVEREYGVPILSKIPIVKRLFTNRSMAKDEQILLILVKPTIIIQKEAEAKQFPLLSRKVAG